MSVLFIGKRFYTNRDALLEHYGRIWQLPWHWARAGIQTHLWLVDYHTSELLDAIVDGLDVVSTPVWSGSFFRHWLFPHFTQKEKSDVVVASGDCYIGWMGLRIARRLKARFVFDVYDKYDEFHGYHSLPGYNLFERLLEAADANLFASALLKEKVSFLNASVIVPNGVDLNLFKPLDKELCRKALGLSKDRIYVGYVGSMSSDRGVDDLVSAVRVLRENGRDIYLLIAGRASCSITWPEFVTYLGNVSYKNIPVVMACCDTLALPYRRSPYLDMASSCKIAEYIAAGRPLAATNSPNFVANFPAAADRLRGLLAEASNPADLARVIAEQINTPRVVALPPGMSWGDVALNTARALMLS